MTKDVRSATTYDYVISHAGRISQIKINSVVSADYEYNARNQLVFRSTTVAGGPSGDMHYVYDRQGHLIAEADAATGTTVREYVWLADMPVAVVADVDTASPILYYVHVDHLNRPIMMTDGLKANVWEAVWLPYGAAHSITGAAANDARFPGQWFQIEAGLHYNWHRHYDPTLARYTQADPLGFVDGPSVFAYALNSPRMNIDRNGLSVSRVSGLIARAWESCETDGSEFENAPIVTPVAAKKNKLCETLKKAIKGGNLYVKGAIFGLVMLCNAILSENPETGPRQPRRLPGRPDKQTEEPFDPPKPPRPGKRGADGDPKNNG